MDITNTKSYENVQAAFAAESQAVLKYSFYAEIARQAGDNKIADLFEKMEKNEREHARIWYKLLNSDFNDVHKNLESAAGSENYEWKNMYPTFADQARKDGLNSLAIMFEQIASIECDHERKFLEASFGTWEDTSQITSTTAEATKYYCIFCGNSEDTPLAVCPVCGARASFSE